MAIISAYEPIACTHCGRACNCTPGIIILVDDTTVSNCTTMLANDLVATSGIVATVLVAIVKWVVRAGVRHYRAALPIARIIKRSVEARGQFDITPDDLKYARKGHDWRKQGCRERIATNWSALRRA